MNYILRDLSQTEKFRKYIDNTTYPITLSGIVCVAKSELIACTQKENNKPIIVITYNEIQAKKIIKDLSYFIDNVVFFPKKEIAIYDYDAESNDIKYERIDVLNKMYNNKVNVLVTTIEAVMQNMISKESLYENTLHISMDSKLDIKNIKDKLVSLGYERVDLIENRGEFSVRGDIIDISMNDTDGVRIELWGDEIDSIRRFKISSQRSIDMLKNIEILTAKENVLEDSINSVCSRIEKLKNNEKLLEDLEIIRESNYDTKIDKYFNEFYTKQENILKYAKDYKIFVDEPNKIEQRINGIFEDNKNLIKELIQKNKTVPEALLNMNDYKLEVEDVTYLKEEDTEIKANNTNFNYREVNLFNGELQSFALGLDTAIKNNERVIILAGTEENRDKLVKLLEGNNNEEIKLNSNSNIINTNASENNEKTKDKIKVEFKLNNVTKTDDLDNIIIKPGQVVVTKGALSSGFEDKDSKLLVISSDEFFDTTKKLKRPKAVDSFKSGEKIVFADLKVGDLVVHRTHGIGIFIGVKTISNDGITKDYIQIKYRDEDVLYVPTDSLDNVRKYIGAEAGIRLNKLGSKEWQETKAKVKGNLRTIAKELIELYAKREHFKGFAFSKDTAWQNQFEASFPYQETDDQLRCISEVKQDMENSKPMDRLLCGDVGYGKTEVAIRAAFKAVMDGKQVAYLAPTTILADQQYQEFVSRMKEYPIAVDILNRFRTPKQQKETIEELQKGKVDIIVGTHRLLSKDVKYKDLGLLIIDEEQRFGVKAKEKIKEYKATVDVLTMTATPIPRTLQMSIVGIRDMSVIYEPPQNRKPIQTYVLEYDKEIIREAITKELERGGQVFYIHNVVNTISSKAIEIQELVPEAKIGYAHGQMTGSQIEEIMQNFIDKKTNVLVCTTILESGIDIPNANTIIVENADRFGLAQLYQIRGRVGRSNRQAYAYITYRKDRMLSEDASQRLKAIKEFTEFGSGFKIATRDLQIRGAGSIFGEVQHGHMEQVGYDMYNKLLNEVIKETKGEKIEEEQEITIDIGVSSYIPEEYIENASQKIEIYQDIANCRTEEDIQNVIDEIIDRYGDMPEEVRNLIEIARIKNLCRIKNAVKIQQRQLGIVFTFEKLETDCVGRLLTKYKNRIQFSASGKPYITLKITGEPLKEIKEFLAEI